MSGNESSNNNFKRRDICVSRGRGASNHPRRGGRGYSHTHSPSPLLSNPHVTLQNGEGNLSPGRFLQAFKDHRGIERDNVLQAAIVHGTTDEIQTILENCQVKGFHIHSTTLSRAMVTAAARGLKFAVQTLMNLGASQYFQNEWGTTALMAAAEGGHIEIMKFLLKKGANSNMVNNLGDTPLLLCMRPSGSADMVKLLLEHGALVNQTNSRGISPLMRATEMRDVDTMKILVDKGANKAGKCDSQGQSATTYAKNVGLREVFNFLGPTKGKKKNYSTSTALLEAVRKRKENAVRILLDCENSEVNTSCYSDTPLAEILKDFSKAKGVVSKNSVPFRILKLLVENGADVNTRVHWQDPPLIHMTKSGNYDGVQLMLQHGAIVNCSNSGDMTPLLIASQEGRNDLINLFLDKKASTLSYTFDNNPVAIALKHGHIESAKLLIERGVKVPDYGEAIRRLIKEKQVEAVKFLINTFSLDVNTHHVLHTAVQYGCEELLEFLFSVHPPADVNKTDIGGFTPAYLTDNVDILEKLIERGANISHKHEIRGDLLINAVKEGKENLVSFLINTGKVCLDNVDSRGWSALMHACYNESYNVGGDLKIVKLLLEAGANVNHKCLTGDTALHQACSQMSYNVEIINALLDAGAQINEKNSYGETVFLKAAQIGNIELLQLLKERGADMDERDSTGQTALMIALKHWSDKDDKLMAFLAQDGSIINAQTTNGMTALMLAATSGDAANVVTLLGLGADVNVIGKGAPDGRNFSALSLILTECTSDINKSTIKILELLIEKGGLASLPPTPLFTFSFQRLVLFDQRKLIKLMVTNGMGPQLGEFPLYTISTTGAIPLSPLLIAIMEGKWQIARFLVDSWFLVSSDLFSLPHNQQLRNRLEARNYSMCVDIVNQLSSEVPSLQKLSFLYVSSALGSFPGREDRVNQLPVPYMIQQKLLFRAQDIPMDMTKVAGEPEASLSQGDYEYDDEDYIDDDDDDDNWSYDTGSSDMYLWRNPASALDFFFDSDDNFLI